MKRNDVNFLNEAYNRIIEGTAQLPNIQLTKIVGTAQGADAYRVTVNGFTVGACTVFKNTVVFASQNINRTLGLPQVNFQSDNNMLDSLNGQQFQSIDMFKQAIVQPFQTWEASVNQQPAQAQQPAQY